jgi:hypothetical protein
MDKTYVFWQGKAKWVRAVKPDLTYNKWNFVLYPLEKHLEEIRALQAKGVKNVLGKDDDGWKINISRPTQKIWKGKIIAFAPPVVIDAEGRPLDGMTVGNGSDVTAKIEVYQHGTPSGKKATAIRWEALKVDVLVPFEPKTDFPEEDASAVQGLDLIPKQTGWT